MRSRRKGKINFVLFDFCYTVPHRSKKANVITRTSFVSIIEISQITTTLQKAYEIKKTVHRQRRKEEKENTPRCALEIVIISLSL